VRLGASRSGLEEADATARRGDLGRNELTTRGGSALRLFLAQLRNPLLGLLVAAASVSIALGERRDGVIILAIMVLSVALGFAHKFRSERTLAALRDRTGRRASVLSRRRAVLDLRHAPRAGRHPEGAGNSVRAVGAGVGRIVG
jgi:magnesium-transporting ATPase (P-type)